MIEEPSPRARAGRPDQTERSGREGELQLTVDCGNSRAKLALWRTGGDDPVQETALALGPALADEVAGWLREHTAVRAGVSSVADEASTTALLEALQERIPEVLLGPDHGLENRTRDPGGVGSDRLYAARGALERVGRSALVVDAGTALTVDAVLASGRGVFLGGAIAPGPSLLARAMAADRGGAARLPLVDPVEPGEPINPVALPRALGRDTLEAMRSGITYGFQGAARTLVEEVARATELTEFETAPVVIGGGARAFLPEPVFAGREVVVDGSLVHRGLLFSLAASARPAS